MSIIDEMRKEAEEAEDAGCIEWTRTMRNWADRLANSGALVPVKDGEECRADELLPDSVFCRKGDLCVITSPYDGSDYVWPMSIDGTGVRQIMCYAPIQPVRLVPVTEAEI